MIKFNSLKNGFALILTLWVLMILSALMLTYSMYVNSNMRNASYIKDKMLASFYADSALSLAAVSLIPPTEKEKKTTGDSGSQNMDTGGFQGSDIDKSDAVDTGKDEKVDPKEVKRCYEKLGRMYVNHKDWTLSKEEIPKDRLDEGAPEIKIVCNVTAEDSKFPINSIVKLKEAPPVMSPIVFTDIKDYLKKPGSKSEEASTSADKDNSSSVAETNTEEGNAASSKNDGSTTDSSKQDKNKYKSFSCVEELLSVEGVDEKLYDGDKETQGLKDTVTVFSDGKVYINTAKKNALAMIPGINEGIASQIIDRVSGGNYLKNFDDLNSITGLSGNDLEKVKKWLSLAPKYYRIITKATVYGITSKAECVLKVDKNNIEIVLINRG